MAQDDITALNCRVRIDKKVHPSLHQELEGLGRRDRCERLRSLAQLGLLAEAVGVDVVAAAASSGSSRPKRSKRKAAAAAQPHLSPAQEPPAHNDRDAPNNSNLTSEDDEGKVPSMAPVPASDTTQDSSREEDNGAYARKKERAEPLRSSSQRLMGMAGMLAPHSGIEGHE